MNSVRKWLHDVLGRGYPVRWPNDDSTYPCGFCAGRIEMDSQGNWFHLPYVKRPGDRS